MNLLIECTTNCNAKCTFCPRYEMTRSMGQMSDELFHKIIKEGKKIGINYYYPYLNGEPFAFLKIYEWLDYMEKERVEVVIYTNAELIDVNRLIKYKNISFLNCSINAATKETHYKIMRGPNFDRVIKNTQALIDKAPFKVQTSLVVNENNFNEIKQFRERWGRHALINYMANWTGARESFTKRKKIKRYCRRVSFTIPVLWDGRVSLCCMDYDGKMIFGDLNKDSLKEIIERRRPIRAKHRLKDFSMIPCRDCNVNTINGCVFKNDYEL